MNQVLNNQRPVRFFLGTPQTDKIQVYKVPAGRSGVLKKGIFTNTNNEDATLTLTVNTVDVMRKYVVPAGATEVIELDVVLEEGDGISLQQDTENAINVTLNGTAG